MPSSKFQTSNKKSISHWKLFQGFTLLELIIVFAIMGTLTVGGVYSFFAYSRNQSFRSAVADVTHTLNDLKSRSISQVKPAQCGTKPLRYYQMRVNAPGSTYTINAMCDTTLTKLGADRTLPAGVTFTNASPVSINFFTATGVSTGSQTITITAQDKSSTITVAATGVISVQ